MNTVKSVSMPPSVRRRGATGCARLLGLLLMGGTLCAHAGAQCTEIPTGWLGDAAAAFSQAVSQILVMSNGDVVVAGNFLSVSGAPVNRIARWDGVAWHALGGGLGSFSEIALAEMPNGDVVAGGDFLTAAGSAVPRIARWDGISWSAWEGGGMNNPIRALVVLPNGDVVAGGSFQSAGGVPVSNVARWDSASRTWNAMGPGLSAGCHALVLMPNGDLIAGGGVTSSTNGYVRHWNGTSWVLLGAMGGAVTSIVIALAVLPNGNLVAGGTFSTAHAVPASNVARFNGTSWSAMGSGLPVVVQALETDATGGVIAGGSFSSIGSLARWNGSTWQTHAGGLSNTAFSLARLPSSRGDELLVGGSFLTAGGASSPRFARYSFTGIPWIAEQPTTAVPLTCLGGTWSVSVSPASGYVLDARWQRDGVDLADGPTGSGSVVSGSASVSLTITDATPADAGDYTCVISNACGSVTSQPATLRVCIADFTCDGSLDSRDFFAFISAFFAHDLAADLTGDGSVTSQDLNEFLTVFLTGC